MNSGQDAVIAVSEERARIGGIEVTKKTVIAATDEGVIAFEINTVQAVNSGCANNNPRAALPAPQEVIIVAPPEPHSEPGWYDLQGKGICCAILLLLFYLIVGVIFLPIIILFSIVWCFMCCPDND